MIDVISIKDPANYSMIAYIGKIEKIFLNIIFNNKRSDTSCFFAKFNLKDGVLHPKIENIPNKVRKKADEAFQKQHVLFKILSCLTYPFLTISYLDWSIFLFDLLLPWNCLYVAFCKNALLLVKMTANEFLQLVLEC